VGVCAAVRAATRFAIGSAGAPGEPESSADGTRIFWPHFLHVAHCPADSSATRYAAPQCSQLNFIIPYAFPHLLMERPIDASHNLSYNVWRLPSQEKMADQGLDR
jgi:hypothetical protein